jgi:hypothetical protein
MPILPMDLFGLRGEYRCGELVGREWAPSLRCPVDRTARTPVEGVRLRDRVLVTACIDKPLLDPGDDSAIRRVVESCPSFDARRPCGVVRFARLEFAHPLFAGRGHFLLAWLRVARTREAYRAFIGRLYPEAMGSLLLEEEDGATEEVECAEDVARLATATERPSEKGIPEEPFASTWAALRGGWHVPPTPEELLLAREQIDLVLAVVDGLPPRQARTLRGRFGIPREAERTFGEIACDEGVSRARIHQIEKVALRRVRHRAFIAACARERQEECARVRFAQSQMKTQRGRMVVPRAIMRAP